MIYDDVEFTLTRSSNDGLNKGRTITLTLGGGINNPLGRKAIRVFMTPEQLGLALTGLGCQPVQVDLRAERLLRDPTADAELEQLLGTVSDVLSLIANGHGAGLNISSLKPLVGQIEGARQKLLVP